MHQYWEGKVSRGQQQLPVWNPPRLCPMHLLLWLTDVDVYPFPVINHNCERNNFQWVLGVLLVNWKAEGTFGSRPNFPLVSEGRAVLRTLPSNLTVWLILGILSGHFRRLSNMPSVSKLMKDGASAEWAAKSFHSPEMTTSMIFQCCFYTFFLPLIPHVKFFLLK